MGFSSFGVSVAGEVAEQKKREGEEEFFFFFLVFSCSGQEKNSFCVKKESQRRVLAFGLPFWGKIIGSIDVSLWSPVKQAERSEMGVVASIKRSTSDTYSV